MVLNCVLILCATEYLSLCQLMLSLCDIIYKPKLTKQFESVLAWCDKCSFCFAVQVEI